MSYSGEPPTQEGRPIRLVLFEDDPIYQMGLAAHLAQFSDMRLVRQVDAGAIALGVLGDVLEEAGNDPVVGILSLDLRGKGEPGLALCRQIRQAYPTLPLVLLSQRLEPAFLAAAYQTGATGYCDKQRAIANLVPAIRQVAAGQSYWSDGMASISQAILARPPVASSAIAPDETTLAVLKRNLRRSGLQQIDGAIAHIEAQLRYPQLSLLDEWVLTGRRRELLAARWLLQRLLSSPTMAGVASETEPFITVPTAPMRPVSPRFQEPDPVTRAESDDRIRLAGASPFGSAAGIVATTAPDAQAAPMQPSVTPAIRVVQVSLLEATRGRLQSSLRNLTDTPLEIDILRDDKKRELLHIVLRQFESALDDLRFSQVSAGQLAQRYPSVLRNLWQEALTEYLGKYSTLPTPEGDVPLVDYLLQDGDRVQTEILNQIPFVPELFAHLIFQAPLTVDDAILAPGDAEAMTRAEVILHHLLLQVANGVMQPLLNRFANIEYVKQTFFDQRLLSTREVERFRNNLSWKYRAQRYFNEPKAIFESRHHLWVLREGGIGKTSVYAPRNQELENLTGIPLLVTLALEARDAIAPRLRAAIAFVGSGVVYVLTEVIGRGLGLVGRGVLKGIGNTFQEPRFNRMNRDGWRGRW